MGDFLLEKAQASVSEKLYRFEEVMLLLNLKTKPALYIKLKKKGIKTRKLTDGSPYLTQGDVDKLLSVEV